MHLIEDLIKNIVPKQCLEIATFAMPSEHFSSRLSRILNLHDNATELYSQLTLNDSVTARPLSIVRETFNPSSLWGAAM